MKKLLLGLLLTLLLAGCTNTEEIKVFEPAELTQESQMIAKLYHPSYAGWDSDSNYLVAENIYDYTDYMPVEKGEFGIGDIILISFENNRVVSTEKVENYRITTTKQ